MEKVLEAAKKLVAVVDAFNVSHSWGTPDLGPEIDDLRRALLEEEEAVERPSSTTGGPYFPVGMEAWD